MCQQCGTVLQSFACNMSSWPMQVRNKLWRAVLRYGVISLDTERTYENERVNAIRNFVHRMLMEPHSSRLAMAVALARNLSSILSSFNAVYMTLPDFRVQFSRSSPWLGPRGSYAVEAACAIWFTAEIMLQAFAIPSFLTLVKRTNFAANALTVVPWYTKLMGAQEVGIFAIMRMMQTIRTLAMIPNSKHLLQLMGKTFRRAAHMLGLLSCLISMFICMLAIILWTAERGEWDADSRMFLRRAGWNCPVTCNGSARFGAYSGCTGAGDEVWMLSRDKIGRQQHLCVPVQVCVSTSQASPHPHTEI